VSLASVLNLPAEPQHVLCEGETGDRRHHRQRQRFTRELGPDAKTAGTERGPDRNLLAPVGGPRVGLCAKRLQMIAHDLRDTRRAGERGA